MENRTDIPELRYLKAFADLLDNRFRIPGTNIRFGLDFLVGLVPYAGDLVTFGFSGLLVVAMARHGASGKVVVKMLWNILLDTLVGAIPVLGDLFDLHFKANRRNYQLLVEHYETGAHSGSAWPAAIGVALTLLVLLFLAWALIFMLFAAFAEGIQRMFPN